MKYHVINNKIGGCGTCVIKTIFKMYRLDIEEELYKSEGLSPRKITSFLHKHKIKTNIKYNLAFENIKPKSIIYYESDHYVIADEIKGNKIKIYDSDRKRSVWLSKKTFEKKWEPWVIETSI